ncbi:Hpt domain-containing protein [Acidocella sp. MX-AZ03]|uniref:Hpt domain-containing protein n=1 Tax=Acidocella sp. MX-AZ03 TaxID=2697363 RepID=UPI0022DCE6EC|nr:Hpt domain-containing protein [Acidocella sp. MX-AZ03]WBO59692.1 Hpt domain-containing protein [Acidocella sp. MX-AZ03]
MEDPLAAIRDTFFQECEEQLAELETGLIAMENGTAEAETVNAVFRAVHSMKGGAGIFALDALVRFAHVFETALDKVRSGLLVASPPVVAVFLRAADILADLVRAARDGGSVDEARIAAVTGNSTRSTRPAPRRSPHPRPPAAQRRKPPGIGRYCSPRTRRFMPRPMKPPCCCAS